MKNKKAQTISGLPNNILALVVAIIILVLGIVIIQEMRDVDTVTQAESSSYTNETLTTVDDGSGEDLACKTNPASVCSVTTVVNATGGEAITSGNYTVSSCTVTSAVGAPYNNTNWNVTYSCTYGGTAWGSANESLVGIGNFSEFIPIIVIALAASIVIGLILLGFAARRTQR